jgi:hypothetical protein
MNPTETSQQPLIDSDAGGNKAAKKVRQISPEAWARICRGRPAQDPAIPLLAARCKVSYGHAFRVARGERRSAFLEAELVKIRAELSTATLAA